MALLLSYWWAVGIVAVLAALYFTHRYAHGRLRVEILKMLVVAEKYVFDTMDAKIVFIAEAVYLVLPPVVKAFVPMPVVVIVVTELYREVKNVAHMIDK